MPRPTHCESCGEFEVDWIIRHLPSRNQQLLTCTRCNSIFLYNVRSDLTVLHQEGSNIFGSQRQQEERFKRA